MFDHALTPFPLYRICTAAALIIPHTLELYRYQLQPRLPRAGLVSR